MGQEMNRDPFVTNTFDEMLADPMDGFYYPGEPAKYRRRDVKWDPRQDGDLTLGDDFLGVMEMLGVERLLIAPPGSDPIEIDLKGSYTRIYSTPLGGPAGPEPPGLRLRIGKWLAEITRTSEETGAQPAAKSPPAEPWVNPTWTRNVPFVREDEDRFYPARMPHGHLTRRVKPMPVAPMAPAPVSQHDSYEPTYERDRPPRGERLERPAPRYQEPDLYQRQQEARGLDLQRNIADVEEGNRRYRPLEFRHEYKGTHSPRMPRKPGYENREPPRNQRFSGEENQAHPNQLYPECNMAYRAHPKPLYDGFESEAFRKYR